MKSYSILLTLITVALVITSCADGAQQPVEDDEMADKEEQIIDEGGLVAEEEEQDMEEEPTVEETVDPELVGTTWQWIRFDDMGEINNLDVEDPAAYTLLLDADGLYHLKADCNMVSGAYALDGSSLSFEAGLTTLAECGPDSHYDRYLMYISNVATYIMEDGTLYLNLWADGGNMVFALAE